MQEIYILDGSIIVNTESEVITIDNKEVQLRPQCHKLLLYLAQCGKHNRVATYEIIGDKLWSEEGGWGNDKKQSLKDCVVELRKHIPYIKNIRGTGYLLNCNVEYIPLFIYDTIKSGKTRQFYEFEFDSLKLKEQDIHSKFTLIKFEATSLLSSINLHIENFNFNNMHTNDSKNDLIRAKAKIESLNIEIAQKEVELENMVSKSKDLYKKVKNNEIYFDIKKPEYSHLKETYTHLLEWANNAYSQIESLKNIVDTVANSFV